MKNFAMVDGATGIVSNVIVADSISNIDADPGTVVEITEDTGPGNIGMLWDLNTQTFSYPA
jgi:hypothetical protein